VLACFSHHKERFFLVQIKALLYFPLSWKMKSQFIFAFAALLVIASLITEGDCWSGPLPQKGRKVGKGNENILTNTTETFNSNRFTKKTDARKEEYRIGHF